MQTKERVVCLDLDTGIMDILLLADAMADLSASGLYSEVATRLRGGEAILVPSGRSYRALSTLGEVGMEQLPSRDAN